MLPEELGSLLRKAFSEHNEVVFVMLHAVMLLYIVVYTDRFVLEVSACDQQPFSVYEGVSNLFLALS